MRQNILLQYSGKSSFHAKYCNHCCCCFIRRNFAISVVVVVVQLTPSLAPSGTWWLMLTLFTIWLFIILTTLMVTSVDCTDCDFWLHAISTQPVCPMQQYPNTQNRLSQIPNTHSQKQIGFWKYQIHRLGSRCLQYHRQPVWGVTQFTHPGRWWQWCLWGFGTIFLCWITTTMMIMTIVEFGLYWLILIMKIFRHFLNWTQSFPFVGAFSMMIVRILIGFDWGFD